MNLPNSASWRTALFALLLLNLSLSVHAAESLTLSIGIHRIQAEVAHTPESRAQGLMHRKSLAGNNGMLFVFPQTAIHCMWMRNTLIPLAVAFLDEKGRLINIAEMLPQTEDTHCAAQPAKFALEMPSGWFKQRGLNVGSLLQDIEQAPTAQ